MDEQLALFLEISARLTGFDVVELEGTGMASEYLSVIRRETPQKTLDEFFAESAKILKAGAGDPSAIHTMIAADLFPVGNFDGLAQNTIFMWYTGQWYPTTNAPNANLETVRNISPQAYVQGLVWAAAETHPPGAKQPGYGSWAAVPVQVR